VPARVAWSGAGIDLKTGNLTPAQIRDAVREVTRNPSYKEHAQRLGASIRNTDALETIAEVVEAALQHRRSQDLPTSLRPKRTLALGRPRGYGFNRWSYKCRSRWLRHLQLLHCY
jgi:hypothetical protein